MGHIQAQHIGTGPNQGMQCLALVGGGTQGGNDFGAANLGFTGVIIHFHAADYKLM
jgi:hypothetical protein